MASEGSTIDPYKFLHIVLNPDGSITRLDQRPTVPSTAPVNETSLGLFKDVPLDDEKGTSLRLFQPLDQTPANNLPVVVYCHGGGFMLQSAAGKSFHDLCMGMAAQLTAIVVSVEYRLAPENGLPAAYEDAVDALLWVQRQAVGDYVDPWISRYADVSRCFLMGGSSGANIAYHAALFAVDLDLEPMKILGLIVNQPFIGGVKRTKSELRLIDDRVLPLSVADLFWEFALPPGSDRDHEYSNPLTHKHYERKIRKLPSCLMGGYEGDPLVDRQRKFEKLLRAHGVHITSHFRDGGVHAAEVFDPTKVQVLLNDVKEFIDSVEAQRRRQNHDDVPPQHNHDDGPRQQSEA